MVFKMNIGIMKKDGTVGDLGSKPENVTTTTVTYKSKGSESELVEYAHSQLIGMVILSEGIRKDGDIFYYDARVQSERGIPGSFRPGLILPERLEEVKRGLLNPIASGAPDPFSFGDVDLSVNICAFGDI